MIFNMPNEQRLIGDEWQQDFSYVAGDFCIYNNTLYKAVANNAGVVPTDGTKWTKTNINNELKYLNMQERQDLTVKNVDGFTKGSTATATLERLGKLRILNCNIIATITKPSTTLNIIDIPVADRPMVVVNKNYITQNGDRMVASISTSGILSLFVLGNNTIQNSFVCRQTFVWMTR